MKTVILKDIGSILKQYREKLRKTQGEIADLAGISTSMLSQIERSLVSPSIDTLASLCSALELSLSQLFGLIEEDVKIRIYRQGKRLVSKKNGVSYEQLGQSPNASHPFEVFLLEIAPGKEVGMHIGGHEGVETGFILEGEMTLWIDGKEHILKTGDSVSFRSTIPHVLKNRGEKHLRAVWSATPPHRNYINQ